MRRPHSTTKSSPCSPQLEKARVQQQRLNAAKKKKEYISYDTIYEKINIYICNEKNWEEIDQNNNLIVGLLVIFFLVLL